MLDKKVLYAIIRPNLFVHYEELSITGGGSWIHDRDEFGVPKPEILKKLGLDKEPSHHL